MPQLYIEIALIHFFLILPCIYFLLAMLGLHCSLAFSLVVESWGLLSSCGAQISHCGSFSCGARASVVVAPRLQGTGCIVMVHGLSFSMACEIFPDQGSNLSPTLAKADYHQATREAPQIKFQKKQSLPVPSLPQGHYPSTSHHQILSQITAKASFSSVVSTL